MHCLTLKELKRMDSEKAISHASIEEEKQTVLPEQRTGSYDFLVETGNRSIGIEVMTRPTKGKMKEKLRYKSNVDCYIFVLPAHSLGLYRKTQKKGFPRKARPKFFPKEFNGPEIRAWLLDAAGERFTEKCAFSKIFNVESQGKAIY